MGMVKYYNQNYEREIHMTIGNIIDATKKAYEDIKGIKVSIRNISDRSMFGNSSELFFGELSDVPDTYIANEVKEQYIICESSIKEHVGAHVLLIET